MHLLALGLQIHGVVNLQTADENKPTYEFSHSQIEIQLVGHRRTLDLLTTRK